MTDDRTTRRVTRRVDTGPLLANRYAVLREIAQGGMGAVYVGRDTVLDRPVAIKMLHPETSAAPREELLREARAAAALQHPGIVDVYDAGVEGDQPYIVMEYVPGETLREVCAREAPLAPVRAALLAAEIAEALEYAHRHGIVHCDVKPGNILLATPDQPKLTDFGIARAAHADATREVAGTAGYVAPEQLTGGPVDGRADIYSLAAVLYELVTGAPPFTARDLSAAAQRRHAPPPPHERNRAVPAQLSDIVMRGLDPDPARRYPSALAFAIALRRFAEGVAHHTTARRGALAPVPVPARQETERTNVVPLPVRPSAPASAGSGRTLWAVLAGLAVVLAAGAVATLVATGLPSGPSTVTVTDVLHRPLADAAEQLQRDGLTVAVPVEFQRSAQPLGIVIGQEPPAGTRVEKAAGVRLIVSEGP